MGFRKKAKAYVKRQAKRAKEWAKKRYWNPSGMANVIKDISMLKTALNVEKKYHDVLNNPTSGGLVATNPYIFSPFDNITQGIAEDQRLGIQIKVLYSSIRIHFELNANTGTTAQTSTMYRIMVIRDAEPRGDAIASATGLRNQVLAQTNAARDQILSHYTTGGFVGDRYKIVRDFRFALDNVNRRQKIVNINLSYIKMHSRTKGLRLKYDVNNELIDDRYYVLVMNDDPSAVNTGWTDFTVQYRTAYVDN